MEQLDVMCEDAAENQSLRTSTSFACLVEQIHGTTFQQSIPTPSSKHTPSVLDPKMLIHPLYSSLPG